MKFNNISIYNFRGIDDAKLEGLADLNLVVGKNNSGKSSILEAFFVLSGMSNPQVLLDINFIRNLKLNNDNDFRYVFKNLNLAKPIELSGEVDNVPRSCKIMPYKDNERSIILPQNNISSNQASIEASFSPFKVSSSLMSEKVKLENKGRAVDGLEISFKNDERTEEHAYISLKSEKIEISEAYEEELSVQYLNSQSILMGMIDLSSMVKKKQIKELVNILKEIEPQLNDIQIVNDNEIYCDVGKAELLPIGIMGDGMRRILGVLSAMYDMTGGVLLLDEVENGLHYSSLKVFWKAVFMLQKKLDVQIIATTHSYEALGALADVKEELEESKSGSTPQLSLYRIEKEEEKTRIVHYDNDDVLISLDEYYEVR